MEPRIGLKNKIQLHDNISAQCNFFHRSQVDRCDLQI